jgi:peptidoglycan/xylan/chitin deacetylase (PgdA/CDA1 family)
MALAAAAVAAHAAPSITAVSPVRAAMFPTLSGVGLPATIALTFDDGPDPRSTPAFLELLQARGVSATFFLLGAMVHRAPELARRVVQSGHEVGVHGYHHRCLLWRGPKSTMDDLRAARDIVAETTGVRPRWFRPPYGILTTSALVAARSLHLQPVLWTAWGRDWSAGATPDSIVRTVRSGLRPGGTVLLHDSDCTSAPGSWRNTLAALPDLLDYCSRQGWRVGPLRRHGVPRSEVPVQRGH